MGLSEKPLISAENLSLTRSGFKIIDEVSLELYAGDRLALFGPNGAGKTTLLRLLAGLQEADRGTLKYGYQDDDDSFKKSSDKPRFKPRLGFLGHDIYLYNDLTGRENLNFFGELYDITGLQSRIEKLTERAGLSLELDEKVRTYSRGMQQKLAICRCFLIKPEVLLLDEPFTGLDSQASKFLIELLDDNSSAAVIFSSHDIELGYQLASSWIILCRGRILDRSQQTSSPDSQDSPGERAEGNSQNNWGSQEFSRHYQELTGQTAARLQLDGNDRSSTESLGFDEEQKNTGKNSDAEKSNRNERIERLESKTGQKPDEKSCSTDEITNTQKKAERDQKKNLKAKRYQKNNLEISRPRSRMKFTRALLVLVKKDLRLEFNTGQLSGTVLLFALIGGTIFSMSFLPGQENIQALFPGIYWFTQIFAALLILNRSFLRDTENSCQEAILLAPISRETFLTARIIFNYLIFLFLAIIISPVLFILFEAFPFSAVHWFPVLVLLVNLGLVANGSLLAALATSTRFSDLLLPVLLLPVLIPLILAAVEGARLFYYPEMDLASLYFWLVFIILYDAVCLLVNFILAPYLLKD